MKDYFKELVEIAFAIERKDALLKQKTADLRRMALLAKQGQKESQEFKQLDAKYKYQTVIDFGDEIARASEIAKKLRKKVFN
jgi:hypothetical protein